MLVDSHAHLLYFPLEERQSVIENFISVGVSKIVNISTKCNEIQELIASSQGYKNIFHTIGTHPCNVQDEPNITDNNLIDIATKYERVIGFGETGLDYYHSTEYKTLQQKQFWHHIQASTQLQKPIIVHTRNADDDTLSILTDAKKQFGETLKVIIHCFTGNENFCQKLLAIGCNISYSGIVTFKNAQDIKKAMLSTPLDQMLIETDSPFLAPVPMRGKRNEPAFVKHVAEFIAKERNITFEELCEITSGNFTQLFGV